MEKKNHEPESDRLISLPETLLHRILTLASIDTKQAVGMSLLSTKWRYIWKSLPTITISIDDFHHGTNQNFINKVLTLHNASHVHTLYLKTSYVQIDVELVDKLINFLLTRHVQEVHIQGRRINMSQSALTMFVSQSKHVKTLKLLHFYFVDQGQQELLDLRSSTLENLVLWCYHKCDSVIVDCPRLDYLMIHNDYVNAVGIHKTRRIKIRAPNLSRIHLQGVLGDYSLEGLSSMIDAHVDIFGNDRKLFSECLDSLLGVFGNAKSLTLNAYIFQEYGKSLFLWDVVHGEVQYLWDAVRVSFPNLKCLKVVEWCTKNHIRALAKFIEWFSSIETLDLESNQEYETYSSDEEGIGAYKGRSWDVQLAFISKYHELKSFHIQFIEGDENELIFIDYILKSAPALENITIAMGKAPSSAKLRLKEFIKKIHSLPSYSSNVIVSVEEKNVALRDMEETESESEDYMDSEEEDTTERGTCTENNKNTEVESRKGLEVQRSIEEESVCLEGGSSAPTR